MTELHKKPVTGMKDILPDEMQVRNYVSGVIRDTYEKYGFVSMETPCVEDLANLNCKAGGENEKLIFKILKRGEKLRLSEAKTEEDVTDGGLRYDLTVPLVRYFACHESELPTPFKALQMGNVWRADRPQRGRYRQFMQCDIDILGEATNLAEIELILASTEALGRLGFTDFVVRINDRRILQAIAAYAGFAADEQEEIFIILDKMDKIGTDGVQEELLAAGHEEKSVRKFMDLFAGLLQEKDALSAALTILAPYLDEEVAEGFRRIIETVQGSQNDCFTLQFDPTLVRGMSYYTGTIFEVAMPQYGGSCGGGGRYDGLIGKFTGRDVPACGISIGFERIIMLLMENGFQVPGKGSRIAYLLEKTLPMERYGEIFQQAQEERAQGSQVLLTRMNKNKKFQKEQLTEQGYTEFREFYTDPLKK